MANTFLHTCYRIGDIDSSVAFYEKLGFSEVGRMPIGDEAINVFMGLEDDVPILELTYNHGVDSYDLGTGYNHIAMTAPDLDAGSALIGKSPGSPRHASSAPRPDRAGFCEGKSGRRRLSWCQPWCGG